MLLASPDVVSSLPWHAIIRSHLLLLLSAYSSVCSSSSLDRCQLNTSTSVLRCVLLRAAVFLGRPSAPQHPGPALHQYCQLLFLSLSHPHMPACTSASPHCLRLSLNCSAHLNRDTGHALPNSGGSLSFEVDEISDIIDLKADLDREDDKVQLLLQRVELAIGVLLNGTLADTYSHINDTDCENSGTCLSQHTAHKSPALASVAAVCTAFS